MPNAAPKWVIRSEGYINFLAGDGARGKFLEWFDPRKDGPGGEEMGGFTEDPAKAKTFDSVIEAWSYVTQPRVDKHNVPYHRADGLLDRPLTAFNMSVIPLSDVLKKGADDNGQQEAADHPARASAEDAANDAEIHRILDPLFKLGRGPER